MKAESPVSLTFGYHAYDKVQRYVELPYCISFI